MSLNNSLLNDQVQGQLKIVRSFFNAEYDCTVQYLFSCTDVII